MTTARFLILFLCLLPALSGQVKIRLTYNDVDTVKQLFGKEPAKRVSMWQLSAKNYSDRAVIVEFADLHDWAGELRLMDAATARGIMVQGDKMNNWVRLGRFTLYAAGGVGLAAASGLLTMPERFAGGLLLFAENGDKLAEVFRGESPPTMNNFEGLIASETMILEPQQGRWGAVFSVPYHAEGGLAYPFVIPETALRKVSGP